MPLRVDIDEILPFEDLRTLVQVVAGDNETHVLARSALFPICLAASLDVSL